MNTFRIIVTVLMAMIVGIFMWCGVAGKNMDKYSRIGWTVTTCILMMAMYLMWR